MSRAEDWYRKAEAQVAGLDAAHVSKRLDEIQTDLEKLGWISIPKKAVIFAASGTSCRVYLNGEFLFSSGFDSVGRGTATLKRGDVLTVHAQKYVGTSSYGRDRGFACVIAFEGSTTPIITGQGEEVWEAYVPSDAVEWYKPENVARTVPHLVSLTAGHTELRAQTGVAAKSLWYAGGDTSEAYFLYRMK